MTHPTDDTPNPVSNPDWSAGPPAAPTPEPEPAEVSASELRHPNAVEVDEETPAGGRPDDGHEPAPAVATPAAAPAKAPAQRPAAAPRAAKKPKPAPAPPKPEAPHPATTGPVSLDDDEVPTLVWYVLKVQSSREDTIRDALERRVKIQGLQIYFGRIVVPTEKITEIRNNKKRIVERKTYPGYIMVEMELNEKTWFVVRETPGVGDFVGAHGTPTKMTETEVNQMLGQETAKAEDAPRVRIDVERGDRVKIKDGPFENFEGTVEEVIEARGLVKVMLIIFNRPTPVDLEYWQLERI